LDLQTPECAAARELAEAEIPAWLQSEVVREPRRLVADLHQGLESLVAPGDWLFDRASLRV
jgi:hypothetical protein